jgi:hypothetical protein
MIRFITGLFICIAGTGLPDTASLLDLAMVEAVGCALMLWAIPDLSKS